MYSVILVDDQPLCLQGMSTTFSWEKFGFEILYKTTDPQIALEMVKELRPDVLCTDMRMPKFSGLELIKAVKTINSNIECIIVSGYEDFEMACEAIRYRVFRYCLKPLDKAETDQVLSDLKQLLDEKSGLSVTEESQSENTVVEFKNAKLKRMIDFVNEHFNEQLSLNDLAEKFHLNPTYVSRSFAQYFNMGFSQYLMHLRLKKSQELLIKTNLSIEKIAYMVGYNDIAYFSKQFRKTYGETAREYRNRENKE